MSLLQEALKDPAMWVQPDGLTGALGDIGDSHSVAALRQALSEDAGPVAYRQLVSRSTHCFGKETKRLIDSVGGAGIDAGRSQGKSAV